MSWWRATSQSSERGRNMRRLQQNLVACWRSPVLPEIQPGATRMLTSLGPSEGNTGRTRSLLPGSRVSPCWKAAAARAHSCRLHSTSPSLQAGGGLSGDPPREHLRARQGAHLKCAFGHSGASVAALRASARAASWLPAAKYAAARLLNRAGSCSAPAMAWLYSLMASAAGQPVVGQLAVVPVARAGVACRPA